MGNALEPFTFTFFGQFSINAQGNFPWFPREDVYKNFHIYWENYSNQKINRRELVEIYNILTSAELTLEACDNIFKSIGEDKNGTISFRDLMLAYDQIAYGSEEEKINWSYKVYNTINDGFISVSELTKIIESFPSKFDNNTHETKLSESQRKTNNYNRARRTVIEIKVGEDGRLSLEEFMKHFYDCQEIVELVRIGIGYKKYISGDDSF